MDSVIERIQKGNFWQFHGGIHPPEQKFLTCTKPIASAQIPEQLIIPIRQHIGQAGDLIVNVGDKVLKGQVLSTTDSPMSLPIHAPTSGTISAIQPMAIPHPSGLSETCIILTPDGEDTWKQRHICPDYQLLSKAQILEKIANAGISGMGGAGFPTQVKVGTLAKIDYLIINAAECEPYITADDLLIQEHSPTILDGIKILDHLLSPKHILVGIEDNKAKAIDALKKATADINHIEVCVIPTKYPSGGEKQLIKILTGQEVPSGVLPSSLGMVMQNVATCFAIADAVINDTPLIKRVVTVSGQALEKPQNVWALIGTPVGFLTEQCGYTNSQDKHLIMGGPMMGFSLPNAQIPVVKTTNCILAPSEVEIASPFSSTSRKEVECIRCGLCADACPAQLLPQELQWSAKAKDQPQLEKLNLFDCIECGACAYVCPSQIPLVHYYRVAKAEIRQQKLLDIKAEKAKVRFEARKQRLEREKLARAEKQRIAAEARKARMNAGTTAAKSEKSAVAAALARVKAKKAQVSQTEPSTEVSTPAVEQLADSKSQVANAIARAKAKKLAQKASADKDAPNSAEQKSTQSSDASVHAKEVVQPEHKGKQAKVAAAIAKAKEKAKAKKHQAAEQPAESAELVTASQQTTQELTSESARQDTLSDEKAQQASDKKAQVAAAIVKAKAKKAAKTNTHAEAATEPDNNVDTPSPNGVITTTAESAEQVKATDETPIDAQSNTAKSVSKSASAGADRKAKIAAAVAKAKAKKMAEKSQQPVTATSSEVVASNDSTQPEQTAIDAKKKARIAATVAKAKAKKLAAATNNSSQPSE